MFWAHVHIWYVLSLEVGCHVASFFCLSLQKIYTHTVSSTLPMNQLKLIEQRYGRHAYMHPDSPFEWVCLAQKQPSTKLGHRNPSGMFSGRVIRWVPKILVLPQKKNKISTNYQLSISQLSINDQSHTTFERTKGQHYFGVFFPEDSLNISTVLLVNLLFCWLLLIFPLVTSRFYNVNRNSLAHQNCSE